MIINKSKLSNKFKFSCNYLIALLVILVTFSPLISQFIKVFITVLIMIILYLLYGNKIKIYNLSVFFILFLSFFAFAVSFIIDLEYLFDGYEFNFIIVGIPTYLLFGFLLSCYNFELNFIVNSERIIFFFSCASLIGYFLIIIYPEINNILIDYSYYNTQHKTALLFNVLQDNQNIIPRNSGIAWEPGAFQFLVSIGLAFLSFSNFNNIPIIKMVIYVLTILSTFSTTGIINLVFFLLFFLLKKLRSTKNWGFAFIFFCIFIFLIYDQLSSHIDSKLIGSESFDVRFEPFYNTIVNSFNFPFGIGNIGFDKFIESKSIGAYDSFGMILNRYGYLLLFTTLYSYLLLFRINFLLGIFFITMFFSQSLWYTPLVFIILFIFINDNERKKNISFRF